MISLARRYPDDLKERFVPMPPKDAGGSMVAEVVENCKVAIFYIDEGKWSVGTVKKIGADGAASVQFGRRHWPYTFEDDGYGENALWVIVTPAPSLLAGAAAGSSSTSTITASAQLVTTAGEHDDQATRTGSGGSAMIVSASDQPAVSSDGNGDLSICSYVSKGCKWSDTTSDLMTCTNRSCSFRLHRVCFDTHFPALNMGFAGKRLCLTCAQQSSETE